ncbi:MAG: hypothetical protein ABSG43_09915 [Solirubrobacteraceae bacterium]
MPLGWQFLIAAGLAGSVGLAEILTRYRSDPLKALGRLGAWLYIALNAGAGAGAFDRSIDRNSAQDISTRVLNEIPFDELSPAAVMDVLPVICLALMQNFSPSDQALMATELKKTREDDALGSDAKMRAVTIYLAKYLGADLVIRVLTDARELFLAPVGAKKAVLERARQLSSRPRADGEAGGEAGERAAQATGQASDPVDEQAGGEPFDDGA